MLKLEKLKTNMALPETKYQVFNVFRAPVPGGWLILMYNRYAVYAEGEDSVSGYGWGYGGVTFIPDPNHTWDGNSV